MDIDGLIAKWETKVKEESFRKQIRDVTGVGSHDRELYINTLKECLADLKKVRGSLLPKNLKQKRIQPRMFKRLVRSSSNSWQIYDWPEFDAARSRRFYCRIRL